MNMFLCPRLNASILHQHGIYFVKLKNNHKMKRLFQILAATLLSATSSELCAQHNSNQGDRFLIHEIKNWVPSTSGSCTIHVYDVFAGDTTFQRSYAIRDDNRRLYMFEELYGGSPETQKYDIQRISAKGMTLHLVGSDVVMNFKKEECIVF